MHAKPDNSNSFANQGCQTTTWHGEWRHRETSYSLILFSLHTNNIYVQYALLGKRNFFLQFLLILSSQRPSLFQRNSFRWVRSSAGVAASWPRWPCPCQAAMYRSHRSPRGALRRRPSRRMDESLFGRFVFAMYLITVKFSFVTILILKNCSLMLFISLVIVFIMHIGSVWISRCVWRRKPVLLSTNVGSLLSRNGN